MPNEQGRYSKEEAYATGLPIYIPSSKRWTSMPYPFAVFLSKSRCKALKIPMLPGEQPSAFLYAANTGTGTGDLKHRYVPLYDGTDHYFLRKIRTEQLYEREIMRGS